MIYRHSKKTRNNEILVYILNHRENERSLEELEGINQKGNYVNNLEMPIYIHSYSDSEPSILEAGIEIKFVKINSDEIYFQQKKFLDKINLEIMLQKKIYLCLNNLSSFLLKLHSFLIHNFRIFDIIRTRVIIFSSRFSTLCLLLSRCCFLVHSSCKSLRYFR